MLPSPFYFPWLSVLPRTGSPRWSFGFVPSQVAALLWFRRKTRSWKIQYDATGYLRKKTEGKSHFLRARVKKAVFRTILRVPSAPAAVMVFFFPFATHLASPNSQNVRGYRVPITWKDTILFLPGRPPGVDFVEALTTTVPAAEDSA
jgi:hypothetical protein